MNITNITKSTTLEEINSSFNHISEYFTQLGKNKRHAKVRDESRFSNYNYLALYNIILHKKKLAN